MERPADIHIEKKAGRCVAVGPRRIDVSAQGTSCTYVEIKITAETNTRAEKAAFIQAVYNELSSLMTARHY
jgi:hypothetical protein